LLLLAKLTRESEGKKITFFSNSLFSTNKKTHFFSVGPKWPQQGPVAEGHRQKSGARSAPDF
jgi:hypothetical protein